MLIDVEADGLAIPEDGTAALLAHVVPNNPLVVPLVEALHRTLVAVLPVPVEEVLVREELPALIRRAVELAAVVPGFADGSVTSRFWPTI